MRTRPFRESVAVDRCDTIAYILGAFPGLPYSYLRNMDYRDRPLWMKAAKRKYAEDQKRFIEAVCFPDMSEADQSTYMENLLEQITERKAAEAAARPTAAQEAEWKRNRDELAAIFGRKL